MQFRVPQFIDIEDKIFGPFTFKQFVYLLGGAALCYVIVKVFPFFFAFIFVIPVAAFSLALTFYKPNGKPFIHTVQSFLSFHSRNKLYVWKKEPPKKKEERVVEKKDDDAIPRLSEGKLKELSWGLDVLDLSNK